MVAQLATTAGLRAIFLDRDGVLVRADFRDGRSYAPTTFEAFEILPEAQSCLPRLKEAGYRLVVVTNQPDVGAGRVAAEVVGRMHEHLAITLPIDDIRACFHTRDEGCDCRKPLPGMLIAAARESGIDLRASYMIGDRSGDVEAGIAAGCRTAFIDLGYSAEAPPVHADLFASTLTEVTDWILGAKERAA